MKIGSMEKKALLAIIATFGFFILAIVIIGKRNLWFEQKNEYYAIFQDADGLQEGSLVTLSGLRVGEVKSLNINDDNKIKTVFSVKTSLADKIRHGSLARLHRAFVIGEKRIEVMPGPREGEIIAPKGELIGVESTDIPDLISGKNLGNMMNRFDKTILGLEKWNEAFIELSNKVKPKDLADTYSLIKPALENISILSKELLVFVEVVKSTKAQVIDNRLLGKTLENTNKIISPIAKREELVESLLGNLNSLTLELSKNPNFAKDVLSTLKEATITLKAIQKTWLLKGHVEDLKKNN